jgi:2-polyprenyl-3-methyl-5-hydroxy-6-metoxy-1,4-benzoquinol methylase
MPEEGSEKRLNEALGYIRSQRLQLEQLRERMSRMESTVSRVEAAMDYCLGDEEGIWLWKNRVERMDPLVPIFDKLRADFHLARYEFSAGYARDRDVADVACGTGYGCQTMADKGNARTVHGFDICPDVIRYANRKYAANHVRFTESSAAELAAESDSFDLLTSFETIEHVDDDAAVIREFARVLKVGGVLICSTPNQWPLQIAPFHVREYDCRSFRALLETQFEVSAMYNQNSGTDWHYNHAQPAGVVLTTEENESLAECFIAVCERVQ